MKKHRMLVIVLILISLFSAVHAQDDLPDAEFINDESGVEVITGEVTYTSPSFLELASQPVILLSDSSSIIDRDYDPDYVLPDTSQTLGLITSDYFESPFSYRLVLPLVPPGEYRDVDNDGEEDTGVVTVDLSVGLNIWGGPYIETRDTTYNSSLIFQERFFPDDEVKARYEITGGKFVVYAPDDEQGFPSGFGEDGLLFTEDDPAVRLPAGYTVVDMNTDPFTFDRSLEASVELVEFEGQAPDDFSDLSYTEAFDALIEKMRKEYAFTEYKEVDWDALVEEFRPRFEEADANEDYDAYAKALTDFTWAIPDGHIGASAFPEAEFIEATDGGIGLAIRELDDGRVIVNFVLEDSPAAEEGIELRAEILDIDGTPIADYISEIEPWSQPFSTEHTLRLQQLRYATRFPVDQEVEITYQNPGEDEPTTTTLTAIPERESFSFSSFASGLDGFELPVEYSLLDNGYGYVKIFSFNDDPQLTIELWERMLLTMNAAEVPGLIIDMRQNGGGFDTLYIPMSSYFFDEEVDIGNDGSYIDELGEFYFSPLGEQKMEPPAEELRYDGPIAVLVGPPCSSACEFFAYNLSLEDRAAIVGQYPTGGLGGYIEPVFLPDDVYFQFTAGRSVDAEGNIHIEGIGVVPTVQVPVDEETLFSEGDPVLESAIAYLDEQTQ